LFYSFVDAKVLDVARPTRLNFPGAWYHVMNRGIQKRAIYRSQRCYEKFVELLSRLPERFAVRLHGYVLMPNHYHLQLETPEANLSQAIHWLNASYGVWFNRKYCRVGPLFQGRFKAVLHEPAEALMINRYIHLNPVRLRALGGHEGRAVPPDAITAQLAKQRVAALAQYPWSSYACFSGSKQAPAWLSINGILEFYGQESQCKLQEAFRRDLQRAAAVGQWESDWKSRIKYTILLGCTDFVTQMRKLLRGDPDQQTGLRRASAEGLEWAEIVRAVVKIWGKPWEELLEGRSSGGRETAFLLARIRGRMSLKQIGEFAGGKHHNAVSIAIRRFSARLQNDEVLRAKVSLVEKLLGQPDRPSSTSECNV
jgi:putative transposase